MQMSKKFIARLAKQEGLSDTDLQMALENGRVAVLDQKNPVILGGSTRAKIGASGQQNILPAASFFLCSDGRQPQVQKVLKTKKVPTGTIPLYASHEFDFAEFLAILESQLKSGSDFVVLSAGVTALALPAIQLRQTKLSSSADILIRWMARNKQESPIFQRFEEILKLLIQYQAAVYFATSLRPGNFSEIGDLAQLKELETLGQLVQICRRCGVSAVVEGPDLLPFNKIVEQVTLISDLVYGAPLILRGPRVLSTDLIGESAALGGVLAAFSGTAGLLTDTVGLKKAEANRNFHQLSLAARAGSEARKLVGK